jgi:outer membrane receptor protein involved in Fe transport
MSKSFWLMSAGIAAIAATPAYAQDNTPEGQEQTPDTATAASGAVQEGGPNEGAATDETQNDGGIIITATRRASPLSDVPIAVSAVTAESLQNSGATDIRTLNQLAPSLLVSSTGTEANGSARIRGIGTVGDNPGLESSVAVFIDGVYRSRTGAGLNELGEIERVEVLRGPQGTLFGRNASAGLINIVSKKPSFTFGGGGEITYGNYDQLRVAAGVTGPITDSVAFRIDGVHVRRDGYYRNVTQGGGSEARINDRDRYFVRGQLLFEPNDDLSFRLIGDYTHRDESCCGAVYVATKETFDPTPTPTATNTDGAWALSPTNRIVDVLRSLGGLVTYPPQDPYDREATLTPGRTFRNTTKDWGLSGELNYDFGAATLTSISAYRHYKSGGAGDVDYSNVDITYRADDGLAYRRFKTFTQELRLQGSAFENKLDWLVGGYYANEKLQLSDNLKFGTQYGAFAACRAVATVNPNPALRNPANPGCLSAAGRAILTGALPGTTPAFGPLTPAIIGGIDRLSTLNNLGDQRAIYDQASENWALFTHNIFNITDTLSLTIGARYTHEKKEFDAAFNNNNTVCPAQQAALSPLLQTPGVPAALLPLIGGIITLTCTGNSSATLNALDLQDEFSESEWTGTAVLSWKPSPRLMTYASYSKGYKAGGYNLDRSDLGGINGVFAPRTNADAAGLRFEPEKVDSFEIGAKLNLRKFNLNVAAFRQAFKTFQLNTFNGSIFIVQNIAACSDDLNGADRDNSATTGVCNGKTKAGVISQGVELEASARPAPDIAVTAGYTYADTHYRNNLVGSSSGEALSPALFLLPGSQLSNAPKHVVTSSFAWTPDIGSTGLSGLVYVDARMTSDYNTGSDLFPEKAQDGFTVVNARLGVRGPGERWALELWGQNIFNVKYTQVAFNTPFQGAGSIAQTQAFGSVGNQLFSAFLAEPRTYGVTGRFRF